MSDLFDAFEEDQSKLKSKRERDERDIVLSKKLKKQRM
jgi:hypothetical protein